MNTNTPSTHGPIIKLIYDFCLYRIFLSLAYMQRENKIYIIEGWLFFQLIYKYAENLLVIHVFSCFWSIFLHFSYFKALWTIVINWVLQWFSVGASKDMKDKPEKLGRCWEDGMFLLGRLVIFCARSAKLNAEKHSSFLQWLAGKIKARFLSASLKRRATSN